MQGETVGPYEIVREMGRGAEGVVYRARHEELNREFALKFFEAGSRQPEARERFLREAEAVAAMPAHPGIVTVHGTGEHEGTPYLVMDVVEGRSLAPIAREGELTPLESCVIIMKAARAMQAAHDAGVVHRDLKPSNIMLSDSRMPRITDFGLARRRPADEAVRAITGCAELVGTPAFVSPEQLRGADAAPPVDIYALGATLYALCTTQPPFEGEDLADTVRSVLEDRPPAPSKLNRSVTLAMDAVLLTCLAKDPAGRYTRAGDLADDLERILRDEPVQARASGRIGRAHRSAVRHPIVVALLVLTVGLLVLWLFAQFSGGR